jgi:hypothetical protein
VLLGVSDVRQLELGLRIVAFEHLLSVGGESLVVDGVDLRTSNSRFIPNAACLLLGEFATRIVSPLRLSIQALYELLLGVRVLIGLHDLVPPNPANDPWSSDWDRPSVISNIRRALAFEVSSG